MRRPAAHRSPREPARVSLDASVLEYLRARVIIMCLGELLEMALADGLAAC